MRPFVVKPHQCLKGQISLLGDKSIAHRSIIISALSRGKTRIENFPASEDCLSTVKAFRKLGIKINLGVRHTVTVFGKGLHGLNKPADPILVGGSGTTLRLLLGVLAGQNFKTKLLADTALSKRPMLRVNVPLRMMGAVIKAKVSRKSGIPPNINKGAGKRRKSRIEEYPPIIIKGGGLKSIGYRMPVASAQVKSAILLAALFAKGNTCIREPVPTRDHTERMLKLFRADIKVQLNTIVIKSGKELVSPRLLTIPGDISSASFFIVSAAIIPESKVLIRNVSLNPSRTGILRVLKRMGADIQVTLPGRQAGKSLPRLRSGLPSVAGHPAWPAGRQVASGEPSGDLLVKNSSLRGTIIKKEEIPSLIDEIPILMVAACIAKGKTIFKDVGELRVKETDRIRSMSENLRKMGAEISVFRFRGREKIIIRGVKQLRGTQVRSFGDHRTAMSMIVAGLTAIGETKIDDISCINKSFPNFLSILKTLRH